MTTATVRAATDVGGTFTDAVIFIEDQGRQSLIVAKADTTPPQFERGVLDVLRKAKSPIQDIGWLSHGTTVVINCLTERKGAKTALITTTGFRDVLEIARGDRPNFFNLTFRKPVPFVPRYLRKEVPGRVDYRGKETVPLDLGGVPAIIDELRAEGVQAIAICLINSYANDEHERRLQQEVTRLWPEVSVVASHQIMREWREYERTNTTVLSAYVQPVANEYLARLEAGVRAAGFSGRLYVMQSNCGVGTVAAARQTPITMVESGPSSGFWGAAELGKLLDRPNVLALDIGGTTAKCSLIEGGRVKIITDYWIERDGESPGYPIKTPVIDLVEIGNGGGSIAWVDDFGTMHVGPKSAGAVPGPVAYGRGGQQPTTTDANLMLGRINQDYFCGGEVVADMAGVRKVFGELAGKLDITPIEAARGVLRIANHNMVDALKLVSLNRGYDPRDFTLVAFGGGGGMHASALAVELGIREIVIPAHAAVFSALGMLMSDLRRDFFKTYLCDLDPENHEQLNRELAALDREAIAIFKGDSVAREAVKLTRFLRMRYRNQDHSVEVEIDRPQLSAEMFVELARSFSETYKREYTYSLDAPVEVVGLHLTAAADVGKPSLPELAVTGRSIQAAVKGQRDIDFDVDGIHMSVAYDGERLEPGMEFVGPAVIELPGTTILVHHGDRVTVDKFGNIHIHKSGQQP